MSRFAPCLALLLAAALAQAGDLTERRIIERLVAEADAGRPVFDLVDAANERGIGAALVAAEFLEEAKPARGQALYEVINLTANCRRLHAEVLRLYHPEAYRLFYTPEGAAAQRKLALGMTWQTWPSALPEAVVRAAPQPVVEWLQAQAKSASPEVDKLRRLLPPLGWWLRSYFERGFGPAFQEALTSLARNAAITGDAQTCLAVLHALADARAVQALDYVLAQTHSVSAEVRAAAAEAIGKILAPQTREGSRAVTLEAEHARALPELLRLACQESEAAVLRKVATAAEAWVADPQIGQAMLELFTRRADAEMQRNLLFAVGQTRWPQRGAIIQLGLQSAGNGVPGVALEAVAAHPLPELAVPTLALLQAQKAAQPLLIDAAGALADARALPVLARWLPSEKNVAVVLKLAQALEKIPGEESAHGLAELLSHSAEPLVVEGLCRIAGRRALVEAVPVLCALAEDATAPLSIRGQAVWALGRYAEPSARECLARLGAEPEKYFPAAGLPMLPELLEQARLYIPLARLRQGEAAMEAEVTRRFTTGTPAAQFTCLTALAEIRRDHPVIERGLASGDFAVLLGAVRAAGAVAPGKYHGRLQALRDSPVIASLATSGLDTWRLVVALENALHVGEAPLSSP